MKIVKAILPTTYLQGKLIGLTREAITKRLGFEPEGISGDEKSLCQYEFTADGKGCSIWDWHRGSESGEWSFYGPQEVLIQLFGVEHVTLAR